MSHELTPFSCYERHTRAGRPCHDRGLRRPAVKGFSLVELVMVIVIMVIVGAIAVPKYANALANHSADAAAARVVADLTLARNSARLGSRQVTVTFGTPANTYLISIIGGLNDSTKSYSTDLGGEPYRATLASVSFGGGTSVTFDGFGAPGTAGTVVVQVGSAQRTLVLDVESGNAAVQ